MRHLPRLFHGLLVFGLIAGLGGFASTGEAAYPFVLRHQSLGGATLRAIAASPTTFVAVGDAGRILISNDGITWSAESSGTAYALRGVTYGGNQFVAVGDNGTVLTSADAQRWTAATTGLSEQLNAIVYAQALYVAVGESGTIATSPDALRWTPVDSGVSGSIRGVSFDSADGYFYAVGAAGLLIVSTDTTTWISRPTGITADLNAALQCEIVGNGVVTTLTIVNSAWNLGGGSTLPINGGADWRSIASWPEGQFTVAVGDGGALEGGDVSPQVTSSGTSEDLKAVTFGQLNFVAVGADETILESASTVLQAIGEITNLSTRAYISGSSPTLTGGFIIAGTGTKGLLIRATGPTLAAFGITSPVAAPVLTIYDASGNILTQNAGWSANPDAATIKATSAQVGAFAFPDGSADSAVLVHLAPGVYTAVISAPGSGITLLELYDTDFYKASLTARLVNLSSLCYVGTGQAAPVTGLSVPTGRSVLLRAVGPTLAQFGIPNVLNHPRIDLIQSAYSTTSLDPQFYPTTSVANNEGWYTPEPLARDGLDPGVTSIGQAYQIQAAALQCGAFPLPAYSDDAALLVTLENQMTLQVSSTDGQSGNVLIEAYDTIQE